MYNVITAQDIPDFLNLEKEGLSFCKKEQFEAALSVFKPIETKIGILDEEAQLSFHLSRYSVVDCILSKKKTSEFDKYIIESIRKVGQIKGTSHPSLIEMYFSLGISLFNSMKYQEAEVPFDKALKIYSENPEFNDHLVISHLFYTASKNLIRKGDVLKALNYCQKALALSSTHLGEDSPSSGKINELFGDCYDKLKSFSKSKAHYEKALTIYRKHFGENHPYTGRIYDRLGRFYITFDDYEKAIQYFEKSLKVKTKLFKPTSFKIGVSNDNIGNAYYYLKEYDKALFFFKKALEIFEYSASSTSIADQYSKIAACYTNMEKFELADRYMDSCFNILDFDRKTDHPFEQYKASHTHLLITLYFKAKNHQKAYEAGWGLEQLYEADQWFGLCIELIEYINGTFEESGSKQYLLDRFYYVFEAAINSKYHLYQETGSPQYLGQAFGYAERSKALLLKEAMQLAGASLALGIPESMLEAERRLNKAIIEKENRRYELQQRQEGQQAIHELNNEIFRLKQEHHQILDSIRQQYPKAHRLRYTAAPLTPGQIQEELLVPGQALLQYFLGEENIFLFVIGAEESTLVKHPVEEGLAEAVEAFRESIYGWSQSQEDSLARQYAGYAYRLYQSLIQPVAHLLPEHLIVIPDGILEYIPFEALLKEPAAPDAQSFAAYPYFIRSHQVSYAHSARLLQEMKEASFEAPRKWVLAFAPSFQDPPGQDISLASRRRSLGRLTSNIREVQYIKSLLRTRIYKGKDATLERFLADAPHYGIIHLATHAKANDEEGEYSYLAFTEIPDTLQNELLYAKDLYSMRLPADMVVLSACESGIGELRRGEGVISLARGFSCAGARSLATTLWRVSDRESAALMQLFYKQLKEGKPKDEALRAAKLEFISRPGGTQAHPFFWAAFILSGNMAPIEVSRPTFPGGVYVLLIGLFVFLALRFAKRKTS